MSLTLVITRNVENRYRGFLASVMLEVAPGVYVSPRLNRDTRERIWETLTGWHRTLSDGSIVMVWRQRASVGGIAMLFLGEPPKEIVDVDGLLLTHRPLTPT